MMVGVFGALLLVLFLAGLFGAINDRRAASEQIVVTESEEITDEWKTHFMNHLATSIEYWLPTQEDAQEMYQDPVTQNAVYETYTVFGRCMAQVNWSKQRIYLSYDFQQKAVKCAGTMRKTIKFRNFVYDDNKLANFLQEVFEKDIEITNAVVEATPELKEKLNSVADAFKDLLNQNDEADEADEDSSVE